MPFWIRTDDTLQSEVRARSAWQTATACAPGMSDRSAPQFSIMEITSEFAVCYPKLNDVGAMSLRPEDHETVLAGTRCDDRQAIFISLVDLRWHKFAIGEYPRRMELRSCSHEEKVL